MSQLIKAPESEGGEAYHNRAIACAAHTTLMPSTTVACAAKHGRAWAAQDPKQHSIVLMWQRTQGS